jgi:hypothetical protein
MSSDALDVNLDRLRRAAARLRLGTIAVQPIAPMVSEISPTVREPVIETTLDRVFAPQVTGPASPVIAPQVERRATPAAMHNPIPVATAAEPDQALEPPTFGWFVRILRRFRLGHAPRDA